MSLEMVQNCHVPLCTKRTYREDGMKISFHKFPSDKSSRDEWIRAIRRDVVNTLASRRTPEYARDTSRKATLNEALPENEY